MDPTVIYAVATAYGVDASELMNLIEAQQTARQAMEEANATAAKTIKGLQEDIGSVDVAGDLLEGYQTYYDVSEQAEAEYWDKVRKQCVSGTEDRLEADKKYYAAKKSLDEDLKKLEEDHADDIKEINENLTDDINDLWDKYTESVKSRAEEIAGAFDIFDAFESESDSGKTLLFNMQSQTEGYEFWQNEIKKLQDKGVLSDDLMEELTRQNVRIR